MSENRFPCGAAPSANGCGREGPRETACIETNRILDSCRDRDCYENARVYLTDMGQELIENTGQVRVKECCIAWTYIGIDPVQFNRGFYAITIRFFVKLICEACVRGGRGQEFDGIAVLEKQVVLLSACSAAAEIPPPSVPSRSRATRSAPFRPPWSRWSIPSCWAAASWSRVTVPASRRGDPEIFRNPSPPVCPRRLPATHRQPADAAGTRRPASVAF